MEGQRSVPRRLAQNTVALLIMQVANVGFSTVLSLLVARRLGAEGLGKYAVLVAYLQIFQVFSMMGVPRLVIREMARQSGVQRAWFQQTVVNQVLGAALGSVVLALVVRMLNTPVDTARALLIVTLSLFPFAISSALESLFRAREQMGVVALVQIGAKSIQIVGSVVALFAGRGIVYLAWMIVLGQVVAAVAQVGFAWRMHLWRDLRVNWKQTLTLFRRSFDFLLLSLSVVLYQRLGTLILSQSVGEEATGLYNAAYLVIRVIHFLSASYSEAVYPILSRLFVDARARFESMLRRSLVMGMTLTLWIAILVFVAARPIIHTLYEGSEYVVSVSLLRIEAPFIVVLMLNAVLSKGLIASNLQRRSLVVSSVKLLAGIAYYFVLTRWLGIPGAAIATVLAGLTGTALNYYFFGRQICALDLRTLLKPVAVTAIVGAVLWLARDLSWPWLVIGSTVLYAGLVIAFRVFSAQEVRLLRQLIRLS